MLVHAFRLSSIVDVQFRRLVDLRGTLVSVINLHLLRTQYQVQIMSTKVDIIAHEEEQPRNCRRPGLGDSPLCFQHRESWD